jgi:lambda repressor-like predicted transcriptional regulator
MIHVMPTIHGSKVRTRAAARGWGLAQLAAETGIPHGTLRNATRDRHPQELSLPRIYDVARALGGDQPVDQVVADLMTAKDDDGVPSTPPPQPKPKKKEPRRKDDPKGPPRRSNGVAA